MDVLLTPDVLSHLGITGISIETKNKKKSFALLSFSQTYITFISVEQDTIFADETSAEIRTKTDTFSIDLFFDTSIKTSSKHWVFRFSYSLTEISSPLKEKFLSILSIKNFQQLRKEIRISMNKENMASLFLRNQEIHVWVNGIQNTCVLHDLSFSGARFISTDDLNIDSDDKLIIKISFLNPSEIATLKTVVLRKKTLTIGDIPCVEIAVRFLDPVDLILLTRLTSYFQQASLYVQLASCEAN